MGELPQIFLPVEPGDLQGAGSSRLPRRPGHFRFVFSQAERNA